MTKGTHTLHRYFIWANRMRDLFDQELAKRGVSVDQTASATIEEFMYMSLWYAQLYTVIEGFNDLKLHDSEIDVLLAQNDGKYVQLLRRYRNGVAHFQADYFDRRFEDFFDEEETVTWVRALNEKMGGYFLARAKVARE